MKRRRLPNPVDRHAELLSAWVDNDGRLGIEVNDHGTVFALLLHAKDSKAIASLVEAASKFEAIPAQPPEPMPGRKAPGKPGKRERLETRPGGISDTDESGRSQKRSKRRTTQRG